MIIRKLPPLISCCVILGAALGCSSEPTAPSELNSTQPVPSASNSQSSASPARFGKRTPGVIYVTSQGLFYDTFATADPLPMEGRFQLLDGNMTEFGPGDPGYLGGRWWVDDGNGIQDPSDHYFLCPLLPPGRETETP